MVTQVVEELRMRRVCQGDEYGELTNSFLILLGN